MRLVALVTEAASVRRFLRGLGESSEAPARAPARGPPYWGSRVLRRAAGDVSVAQAPQTMETRRGVMPDVCAWCRSSSRSPDSRRVFSPARRGSDGPRGARPARDGRGDGCLVEKSVLLSLTLRIMPARPPSDRVGPAARPGFLAPYVIGRLDLGGEAIRPQTRTLLSVLRRARERRWPSPDERRRGHPRGHHLRRVRQALRRDHCRTGFTGPAGRALLHLLRQGQGRGPQADRVRESRLGSALGWAAASTTAQASACRHLQRVHRPEQRNHRERQAEGLTGDQPVCRPGAFSWPAEDAASFSLARLSNCVTRTSGLPGNLARISSSPPRASTYP